MRPTRYCRSVPCQTPTSRITVRSLTYQAGHIKNVYEVVEHNVAAEKLLQSHALVPCSNDGIISVNHFDIVFTPGNMSATISFDGQATYAGKIRINLELYVYGYKAT